MRIFKTLIIAAIALSATACCKCDLFQKRYGKPLVGTQWQLVQIGNAVPCLLGKAIGIAVAKSLAKKEDKD